MVEINYALPLQIENLYLVQIPQGPNIFRSEVKEAHATFLWKEILAVEEFNEHHVFGEEHREKPKCRIVLRRINGSQSYICLLPYEEMKEAWIGYIKWRNNRKKNKSSGDTK